MKAIILDFGGVIASHRKKKFKPIFPNFDLWNKTSEGKFSEENLWKMIEKYNAKNREEILDQLFKERELNVQLIKFLRDLTDVKLAIINNGLYRMLQKAINEWSLDKTFNVIINSAQEKVAKPNPKIFSITCKKLGVKPDKCIFIDDNKDNVEAAKGLGMTAVVYKDMKSLQDIINKWIKINA